MRGTAAVFVIALVVALALGLARTQRTPRGAAPGAEPQTDRAPRAGGAVHAPKSGSPPNAATAIIIDDILVEKSHVCLGEENLITVLAHATDPRETPHLRVTVNGVPGARVPLRVYQSEDPNDPVDTVREVVVTARDGSSVDTVLPPLDVRECYRPELLVTAAVDPLADGRVTFRAAIDSQLSFDVVRYTWTFDDGTTEETSEPLVTHDYAARPQTTAVSNFLVSCTAELADGLKLRGRAAVVLENPLARDARALSASGGRADSDGTVTVTLRQDGASPLPIVEVLRRPRRLNDAPRPERAPFPIAAIAPGVSTIRVNEAFDDETVAIEYTLRTPTSTARFLVGHPALPPEVIASLDSAPFNARVERARALLAVERVTLAELMELERQYVFTDLVPQP